MASHLQGFGSRSHGHHWYPVAHFAQCSSVAQGALPGEMAEHESHAEVQGVGPGGGEGEGGGGGDGGGLGCGGSDGGDGGAGPASAATRGASWGRSPVRVIVAMAIQEPS